MNCIFYWYENVVFPAQAAEYSYFSVDFRLKIFLNRVVAYGISTLECIVSIDLVTVFDAILTSRQTREKLQCLYENLMSNIFRKTAALKKI